MLLHACKGEEDIYQLMLLLLTGVKDDVLVALLLGAGADEELWAHTLYFFHLTPAGVVILQGQAVELVSWVVADGIKGDIVVFLPPLREKTHVENAAIYWVPFDVEP